MACFGISGTCSFEVSLVKYEGLRLTQRMQMYSVTCMPKRYILASGICSSSFTLDPCF
jgi:hypothetical protein